jgi:hypothetical protein
MSRGWRPVCFWLTLVILVAVGWIHPAGAGVAEWPLDGPAAATEGQPDPGDPARPPEPAESESEGEPDKDSPERVALLADRTTIPPAVCAGRLIPRSEHLLPRVRASMLYRPPRV